MCELMEALDDSQPKISRHLAQLRTCGMLCDRRQGQWVFYRINPDLPQWAKDVLVTTLATNQDFVNENQRRLQAFGERPERIQQCC